MKCCRYVSFNGRRNAFPAVLNDTGSDVDKTYGYNTFPYQTFDTKHERQKNN